MQYIDLECYPCYVSPEQLFYYHTGNSFFTSGNSDEYFAGFYLKKHLFGVNSFQIRTSVNPENGTMHPLTWKVIGSIDGKNWNVLDSHENDNVLNGQYLSVHFNSQEYIVRYIRFVSPKYFSLRSIEFFGNLYPNNIVLLSCPVNNIYNRIHSLGLITSVIIIL